MCAVFKGFHLEQRKPILRKAQGGVGPSSHSLFPGMKNRKTGKHVLEVVTFLHGFYFFAIVFAWNSYV